MRVIYANQIVSLIFFTLRGLDLYHSRRVIYQAFKSHELHERRIATLSHFGIAAITRVIAPKRLTLYRGAASRYALGRNNVAQWH